MALRKKNPFLALANSYFIDSPQPSTISYWWNIGSLLGLCLVIQLATGIFLAMHYSSNLELAFISVEHIMRDVSSGWAIRYAHANGASFFFILIYAHMARGIYYGSYKSPRVAVWIIGVIIFLVLIITGFMGYVLPMGQMSLWGVSKLVPYIYNNYIIILIITNLLVYIYLINPIDFLEKLKVIKYSRLKGKLRIGPHNKIILDIIFGSLLGDGHLEKRSGGSGSRLSLYQEASHIEYIHYLHNLLSNLGYCNPKILEIKTRLGKGGKLRKIARFQTWTYTSFNWIYDMWYINNIKQVPQNIGDYLTPLGLAIWIMDDGGKTSSGLKLATNGFKYEDCLLLINVLNNNFNLKSSVISAGVPNQFCIYIWKESMDHLRDIISPYIIKEMQYKISPTKGGTQSSIAGASPTRS